MCISEGMGIAPWGAIGQGRFQRKKDQGKSTTGRSAVKLNDTEIKVSAALEKVADTLKVESVTAVALAYVMAKYPYVYPIIGGRKVEHLEANIGALDISLTPEQVKEIDSALPFDYGQPQAEVSLSLPAFGYALLMIDVAIVWSRSEDDWLPAAILARRWWSGRLRPAPRPCQLQDGPRERRSRCRPVDQEVIWPAKEQTASRQPVCT